MNSLNQQVQNIITKLINASPFQNAFYLFILILTTWLLAAIVTGNFSRPPVGDEADYINRGNMLVANGLEAISDGYRPPLFPLWVSFISLFVPENMLLGFIRFFNIVAISLVPALWWWAGVKRTDRLRGMYFFMALLFAIWPPLFLFSFHALAEAGSFLFLNVLLLTLLGFDADKSVQAQYKRTILISVELSILFLLKANNLLITVPVALFVFFTLKSSCKNRIGIVSVLTVGTIVLILPWILFLYQTTGQIKATTTGGVNFLIGTGHHYGNMSPDPRSLPDKYIHKNVEAYHNSEQSLSALSDEASTLIHSASARVSATEKYTFYRAPVFANLDSVSKSIAVQIWQENTNEQIIHGLLKIAHSYGGSMIGGKDFILIIFLTLVMIGSILAWKEQKYRALILLHWGFVFCGFVIAFFFLPNIRFKTFYFDSTGLLILAMVANHYFGSIWLQSPNLNSHTGDK